VRTYWLGDENKVYNVDTQNSQFFIFNLSKECFNLVSLLWIFSRIDCVQTLILLSAKYFKEKITVDECLQLRITQKMTSAKSS